MHAPVRTVSLQLSLDELEEILLREGLQGVLVVGREGPLGWASRSDIVRQHHLDRSRFEAAELYFEPFDTEGHLEEELTRVDEGWQQECTASVSKTS